MSLVGKAWAYAYTLAGSPRPLSLIYHVTGRCNFKCGFCNLWRSGSRLYPVETPADEIKRHVEQFADLGTISMSFTGGEPLIRKELPDLYAHAKDCGINTILNTNGWFVQEKISELAPHVDYAEVSIDSPDPKENDLIRGMSGAFDRGIKAVELLKEHSVPVTIAATITNGTLNRLGGLSKLGQILQANVVINVVFQAPLEHGTDNTGGTTKLNYGECAQQLKIAKKLPRLKIDNYKIKVLEMGGNNTNKPICRAASVVATVSADGKLLLPCLYHPEAHLDLRKGYPHIKDAWYSDSAQETRRACGRYPYCEGCMCFCYFEPSELGMPRDLALFFSLVKDLSYRL